MGLSSLWYTAYDRSVQTTEEAIEALAVLGDFVSIPKLSTITVIGYWIGRFYQVAGKEEEALIQFKRAANSCRVFDDPFAHTRSFFFR